MQLHQRLWTNFTALGLLALSQASWSQDNPDVIARYDVLSRQITRGTGGGPDAAKQANATAYERLEWNGLLWMGRQVVAKEAQAQAKLDTQLQRVAKLNAETDKLNQSAAGKESTLGTGGIGKPGMGWYCQRAREMMPQLDTVATGIKTQADRYVGFIRAVPLGEGSESTRRVSEYGTNFNKDVLFILTQPPVRAMIKDLQSVTDGFKPGAALADTEQAGKAAAAAAYAMRNEGKELQQIGVELIPMLNRYVEARLELGQEIAALAPLVKDPNRAAGLQSLASQVRESRKSARSADEWQKLIRATVDDSFALADKRLDAIQKLKDPASAELQACKGEKDLSGDFARARQSAHATITGAQTLVETAVRERARQIAIEDRKLDQAIKSFEMTEADAAAKAKQVFAQLQVMDRKSPEWREKEQQYDRLEALRKRSRAGIDSIREQRNEYAKEQQSMNQVTAKSFGDLAALLAKGP